MNGVLNSKIENEWVDGYINKESLLAVMVTLV